MIVLFLTSDLANAIFNPSSLGNALYSEVSWF